MAPSLAPLQYITPTAVGQAILENAESALWSLLLPIDQQDAVAIFISEGVSGFAAGAAAKGIAIIDGNKNNRESSIQSAESSATYFGTAGAIRSLAQLAGLSTISVNLLALFFAFSVSELVKIRNSNILPQRTRVGRGPTMYELMKFKDPSMLDLMKFAKNEAEVIDPRMKMMGKVTQIEIVADLFKWIFFYALPRSDNARLEQAAVVGALAGIASQLVRETKDRQVSEEMRKMIKIKTKKQKDSIPVINPSIQSNSRQAKVKLQPRPVPKVTRQPSRSGEGAKSKSSDNVLETGEAEMKPDYVLTRFARSAVECAAQLLTYEAARKYVMEVAPYFQQGIGQDTLNSLLISLQ